MSKFIEVVIAIIGFTVIGIMNFIQWALWLLVPIAIIMFFLNL